MKTIDRPGRLNALRECNNAVRTRYPLLYWTTFAYIVGVPNFVHFDSTGRTSSPINLTSISTVIVSAIAGYLFIAMLLLSRQALVVRKLRIYGWIWIALVVELIIATALGPRGYLNPVTTTSRLLAFFRLGQWIIAFSLIIALVSRTPAQCVASLVTRLVGQISWVWIGMVWLFLPIMPSQVYGGAEDDSHVAKRLGGQLINPAHVALLASIGFFYALLFFPRGPRKWIAILITLPSIILTGARAQQGGFLLAFLIYALLLSRKATIRWATIGIVIFSVWMAIPFSSTVAKYVARGQSAQTLASLDDRTRVWQACIEAIKVHPFFGYGYSVGARSAIRDHWKFAHWVPPHAHNEFLETALDGGIIALLLVIAIYGLVLRKAIRDVRYGDTHLFLFLVIAQCAMDSMTGGALGFAYRESGGIFLLCAVGVLSSGWTSDSGRTVFERTRRPVSERRPALLVHRSSHT